jgi:transposase
VFESNINQRVIRSMARVEKNKRGPTKYRSDYAEEAMRVCASSGATTGGLAEHFGVSERTVRNWKQRHKDFRRAVERGLKEFRKGYPSEQPESGRESLYEDGYAEIARELALMGADAKKLAEAFKVSLRTIYHWMQNRPEFGDAIEDGRRMTADFLEDNLFYLAEPHDEVIERETPAGLTRITKKNVVSEKALIKVLEAYKPERYGKKVEHKGSLTLAQVMAAAVKRGRKVD